MSRSWERKVQKNSKLINARRRKEGKPSIGVSEKAKVERFQGRNYYIPLLLVLLIAFYLVMLQPWKTPAKGQASPDMTMTWVTVGCYLLLAVFYYFRRPYLAVAGDTLETRKFSGYKRLKPLDIRKFVVTPSAIVVETIKGGNWVFSGTMTRYPIATMAERLRSYASQYQVELEERAK